MSCATPAETHSPLSQTFRSPERLSTFWRQLCSLIDFMKRLIYAIAASAFLLGFAPSAQAQISFDVHIGNAPPPPRAYHVPPQPGPEYAWVEGYWYPQGSHYAWHNGYWTRPPYQGAYWVAPYWHNREYFAGHWEGNHANIYHDHRWDRSAQRDEHREHHDDHDRN
jgi:hypothetical protein